MLKSRTLDLLRATALGEAELLNPPGNGPQARFVALRDPRAKRWEKALHEQNCVTDVRGDVLRIGFAIYQDEVDVDRFAALAGELALNPPRSQPRTGLILGLLLLSYIFNFLDRQIVAILAIPIKADLGLSDTQLGLLGGIAFAALYSTLAIPIARIADRTGRARVIAIAVAVWSGFTALCGLTAISPNCSSRAWAVGHRRSRRGGAELCVDRRPCRAAETRAGAGYLLARNSDRLGARPVLRRLAGAKFRLAHGVHRDRPGRHSRRAADPRLRSRPVDGEGNRR